MNNNNLSRIEFITLIKEVFLNEEKFNDVMVSFDDQGCFFKDEAIEYIAKANDDELPSTFIIAAYPKGELDFYEITSITITKNLVDNDSRYLIESCSMSGIPSVSVNTIPEVIYAASMMIEVVNNPELIMLGLINYKK